MKYCWGSAHSTAGTSTSRQHSVCPHPNNVCHALPATLQVELNAVELEGDDSDKKATHEAVKALLLKKGVITADVSAVLQHAAQQYCVLHAAAPLPTSPCPRLHMWTSTSCTPPAQMLLKQYSFHTPLQAGSWQLFSCSTQLCRCRSCVVRLRSWMLVVHGVKDQNWWPGHGWIQTLKQDCCRY